MRLDELVSQMQNISRSKAQSLIKNELVFVDEKLCVKPAKSIVDGQKIEVKPHFNFVSRGALKLLGAIKEFGLNFQDKTVLDMGASTGGFTQVALQNGAKKVYAVDVGKNQLDKNLAQDCRVKDMQNTDIRTITKKNCPDVDIIVGDLSFISLEKVLPHLITNFKNIPYVILFKPQFECGAKISKKYAGIIKDKKIHVQLLNNFVEFLKTLNVALSGLASSSIKGGDGNIEYLVYLNGQKSTLPDIETIVENAFKTLK